MTSRARAPRGILGGTARRGLALAALAAAVLASSPSAAPPAPLPPAEAFDESPAYSRWQVVSTEILRDGETAQIRLRHPQNPRVIARLTYRLIASSVVEADQ